MTPPRSDPPFLIDDRIRGVPPGTRDLPLDAVAAQGWHPAEGAMSLPVLTLDEAGFARNRDLLIRYARENGAAIAPHAKTPMAPDLARSVVEAGGWGAAVADIRQAAVMLHAGVDRLILANEVGGRGGAGRLAALLTSFPEAELYVFVDSVAAAAALAEAFEASGAPPPRVLVEVGAARAGARTLEDALAIVERVAASPRLVLGGVATYEGSVARETLALTLAAIDALLDIELALFHAVRERAGSEAELVVTGGGSVFFDRVVAKLAGPVGADGHATLVLRSGAALFNDHGLYERVLASTDARGGFRLGGEAASMAALFTPVLRVWAEVLSCPEPGLAVCGLGMRDVAHDQGLPVPLRLHRDGVPVTAEGRPGFTVLRLNDQHAFLAVAPGDDVRLGDVVEFGISHPCTTLQLYRFLFATDAAGRVTRAIPTAFG